MTPSVFDHIRFQSRLRPHALAVFGAAGPVAYQTLVHDVDALATELLERDLTRQDMVGIQLGFSYLHLLVILALDRLTIPSMSFATRESVPAGPALREQYDLTAMIAAGPASIDMACRWIQMAEQNRPQLGRADAARLARIDSPADGLVRLSWSSGTTGAVKGSPMTRTVQAHRLTNRRLICGMGSRTRYFTGMPLSSATGYAMALAVLSAGGAAILPGLTGDFVSSANTLGVTLTSASPAMLVELLGKPGAVVRRLETIQCFEVLGEPLSAGLARDARLFLTPNISIVYGSTEADRVATADSAVCIADPSAAGFVTPCIEAQIVDSAEQPLPNGQEGRLRVRGAQLIAGYHKNPDATRRNFRDGWFYPGDLGTIADQGLLRVTGRIEDVIARDGVSVSALSLEEMMRGVPGISDVAAFPMTGQDGLQEICAALVLEPGADAQTIRTAVTAKLGAQAPTRLFAIDSLPRNANGKLLRRVLVEWAQRTIAP